jgi:hypothetical protein
LNLATSNLVPGVDDLFGLCPECHEEAPYLNIGKSHWKVCDKCKTCWPIGSGLFSSWQEEDEATWEANRKLVESLRRVEPFYLTPPLAPEEERRKDLEEGQRTPFAEFPDLTILERLRYGTHPDDTAPECPHCGATAGMFHAVWCEGEHCPRCQLLRRPKENADACSCGEVWCTNSQESFHVFDWTGG